MGRSADLSGDRGASAAQFTAAVGLSMLFLVGLTGFIVHEYGRGVVRGALDEGVRAASVVGATEVECLGAFDDFVDGLLGPGMRDGIARECAVAGGEVRASADVVFAAWLPGTPNTSFSITAVSVKEP